MAAPCQPVECLHPHPDSSPAGGRGVVASVARAGGVWSRSAWSSCGCSSIRGPSRRRGPLDHWASRGGARREVLGDKERTSDSGESSGGAVGADRRQRRGRAVRRVGRGGVRPVDDAVRPGACTWRARTGSSTGWRCCTTPQWARLKRARKSSTTAIDQRRVLQARQVRHPVEDHERRPGDGVGHRLGLLIGERRVLGSRDDEHRRRHAAEQRPLVGPVSGTTLRTAHAPESTRRRTRRSCARRRRRRAGCGMSSARGTP